ncbi:beta-ketoacyl-ACP synthase III [Aminomonas paucivorans]|uniref:Beta-ketoacyl-[acyl-carrier-protein] synthase III n=1 Tax=Aminomonas paucivorans DSM 12260 TaxID=584708 RepID=E3CYC4_9BACT|nr:beta-ketoacyl-ACP synthase III [Aminomonas paucivorans]EFQ23657.1 3-oxoacyl-(acyl-carrier-protein) synthase III [Aminomonas paucivorans DSM 12260]
MSLLKGVPVGLLGTGIALPEKVLTNQDLEKMVETTDQWIVERTGIRTRHVAAEGTVTTDLAEEASRKALSAAGVAPEDLDLILVGTNSPDTLFPSVAAKLQGRLGAKRAGASDIQSGCTGSVYALTFASAGIAAGLFRNVLVVGAEVLSRLIDWTDRNTCILFGDGAGAAVLGRVEEGRGRFLGASLRADGAKHDLITFQGGLVEYPASEETLRDGRHFVRMKGNEVFKFVNRELPPFLEEFCKSVDVEASSVDWWVFHQANWRIMEGVLRRFGVPAEKAVVNLDRYGNTSAASVMIALHEALEDGRIGRGQKVIVTSFGAGMTYGAVLFEV